MDRILLIDGMNAIFRASVNFGGVKVHTVCSGLGKAGSDEDAPCGHKSLSEHCVCGARIDPSDGRCFGDKFQLIFNFFRNLRPLIEDCAPDKCFFCLEGRAQFRYDLLPSYKENRIIKRAAKSQEESTKFLDDANEIIRLLQYLPITIARASNYEADDLIGTICDQLKDEDLTVITNDMDYIQLLQRGYKNITVFNPIKKIAMEAPSYNFIPFRCLAGDKSDNIPALLKPAKALKTINDPQLFQAFLASEGNRSLFNINKKLITFQMVPEEEIILQEGIHNFPILKEEFARMDFQSMINDNSWQRYIETFACLKY